MFKIRSLFTFCLIIAIHSSLFAQEKRKIDFVSNTMEMDKSISADAKRLIGNVEFYHNGVKMYCDSAYFYSERNALDAYSNVVVNQGDTLFLYSNKLFYDGNTQLAKARENVVLIDDSVKLYTQALDFDMSTNIGFYLNHGKIVNDSSTLYSKIGYYYSNDDMFYFKDSVKIYSRDYTVLSDTMKYNTKSEIVYFLSPTTIFNDTTFAYSEKGMFDSKNDIAQLKTNAYIINKEYRLDADSIYVNNKTQFSQAFKQVKLYDSINKVLVKGEYGQFKQDIETGYVTENALLIQYDKDDTLYLHADTLKTMPDTNECQCYNMFKAYHKVKYFRNDFQGKCDSLSYSTADSIIRMYNAPILWSEENQMTSEYIEIFTGNNNIDSIKFYRNGFIISQEDSIKYNQIKGKLITGFLTNNELTLLHIRGNGETVYYPKDGEEIIGVNSAKSTDLNIRMKENKIKRIYFLTQPDAVFSPIDKKPAEELILKGFKWQKNQRPLKHEDVFIWNE